MSHHGHRRWSTPSSDGDRRVRIARARRVARDLEREVPGGKRLTVEPVFGFVCPRPDKRHVSRRLAGEAVANLERRGEVGLEVYACPCGGGWCVGRRSSHPMGRVDGP